MARSIFDLLDVDFDRESEGFFNQAREWPKQKPGEGVPFACGTSTTLRLE